MTTTIFITLVSIAIIIAIYTIKKRGNNKPVAPQSPITKSEYSVPQISGQVAFNEYSEYIDDAPKEVAKNVSKWSEFQFLYTSENLLYKDNAFSTLANGVYVVESTENNIYYNWMIIISGVIEQQGVSIKPN